MKKIQLTRQGFDKLNTELNELKTMKRPLTVDRLQKARSMGDLKENSGYQSAREELGELDGKILEVVNSGYKLHDKLIRAPKVKVAHFED